MLNQLTIIIPEILITALVMIIQTICAFYREGSKIVASVTVILLVAITYYLLSGSIFCFSEASFLFNRMSPYKALVLYLTTISLITYVNFNIITKSKLKIEFVTLLLLSTVGGLIAISAEDLMMLFCGLELQFLSSCALAAFSFTEFKSSEAALKYFILGALIGCVMLLGISFLYGFSGSIKFSDIRFILNSNTNLGLIIGSILLLTAILFKLSAAPFHIWTPDVYEGSPIAAVSYFSAAHKMCTLIILISVVDNIIGSNISANIIKIAAVLSMIIGSLGAVRQVHLKRLIAYSTILNIGYCLVGVCVNSASGNKVAVIYMLIYAISTTSFFSCLIILFGKKIDSATFEDLKGIANKRKLLAATISIIMFSMIGLPPFAGFFGKYLLFYNAFLEGEIVLVICGVITSIISAFYYIKVIKYMYFINIKEPIKIKVISREVIGLLIITSINIAFIILLSFFASYIVNLIGI